MASPIRTLPNLDVQPLPVLLDDIPILYEEEEEEEEDMGESDPHAYSEDILRYGLKAHLHGLVQYRVFTNLNLYYRGGPPHPRTRSLPNVSPDTMVVEPEHPLGDEVVSYRIGVDGPAPVLVVEVLSERSAKQRDLKEKLRIYALLGVPEYILVAPTRRFLPERLALKRLQPDRTWVDVQDTDGGVTSQLGFRLIWDSDGWLRVVNAATGNRYARPDEAEQEAQGRRLAEDARRHAEERVRQLEAQLARLKNEQQPKQE